jgi:hypothetical protein
MQRQARHTRSCEEHVPRPRQEPHSWLSSCKLGEEPGEGRVTSQKARALPALLPPAIPARHDASDVIWMGLKESSPGASGGSGVAAILWGQLELGSLLSSVLDAFEVVVWELFFLLLGVGSWGVEFWVQFLGWAITREALEVWIFNWTAGADSGLRLVFGYTSGGWEILVLEILVVACDIFWGVAMKAK